MSRHDRVAAPVRPAWHHGRACAAVDPYSSRTVALSPTPRVGPLGSSDPHPDTDIGSRWCSAGIVQASILQTQLVLVAALPELALITAYLAGRPLG